MSIYDYCSGGEMKYEIIKGSEKDFEGAPEWAALRTFTGGSYFFAEFHGAGAMVLDIARNDEFKSECDPTGVEIIAERRPITEPVWDGEGLPAVGSRIQYSCIKFDENRPAIESGKWYGGTVIAYHDGAVWTSDNGIRHLSNTIFRPIRSPEDVARDEAIDSIQAKLLLRREVAIDFYDAIAAGKIPGIKLEGI